MTKGLRGFQKGHPSFHTESSLKKISEAAKKQNLGKHIRTPEIKAKMYTLERNKKLSNSLTGKKLSEEHKQSISKARKGFKISEETKHKISLALKERVKNGTHNFSLNKGKKMSREEIRKRLHRRPMSSLEVKFNNIVQKRNFDEVECNEENILEKLNGRGTQFSEKTE